MKAARVYAGRLNWAIVPLHDVSAGSCSCGDDACRSAGKHPRRSSWQREATSDLDRVDSWIEEFPTGNVGIATGSPSNFFVLDVDGDDGRATLADLIAEHGDLPATVQARTGSGGDHYLFKLPDFRVGNSVGKENSRVGYKLDIRGEGGQIVVAPSVSSKGPYRWVRMPGTHEFAEAPEWLLERIRPRVERSEVEAVRGEFPPANDDVIAAATEALEAHGPAVEGDGGDDHTFRACALLTHDFALTFEEAWPIAWEWNETCDPPWSAEDLAAKLRGGARYGSGEFGAKRTADALQTVLKMITAWEGSGTGQLGIEKLMVDARSVVARGVDPVVQELISKALESSTGVRKKALALPGGTLDAGAEIPPGAVEVTTEVHKVANEATKVIAPLVFQRNGVLCEVVKTSRRTSIHEPKPARLQDIMSKSAKWMRKDEKGELVSQAPPPTIAEILYARRTHEDVRELEAVTTAPIFLADGSILQERGYNAKARVFLEPSVEVSVPDNATREQALEAVETFRDLLTDFKFSEPADFSSWLATLLSPLVKAATDNAPAPLLCVSASSAGAGKTKLTQLIARIVTGNPDAEIRPYNPKDPAEWGKRLTAFVKMASPVSVFDNVNGRFGDEGLDRLLTSSTWSDRQLGVTDAPPLPNVSTWLATGNNIEPTGDTIRRVLMCRIEVDTERPQERSGFRWDPIEDVALEYRAHYLSHALTILRAYHVAGKPEQKLPSWGSFTTWSRLVRGALVWAGCADPFLTQRRATLTLNDSENEAHDFWISVVEATSPDGSPGSIATMANQRNARGVLGVLTEINTYTLRGLIQRFIDRPRGGKRIRRDMDQRQQQTSYRVEHIAR